jgi:transposase
MRAMELLDQGLNLSQAAAKIGCAVSSVCRWRQQMQREGRESLKSKPLPGPEPKLKPRQKEQLTGILVEGAQKAGFSTDLWTQKRVAKVIGEQFGIDYHPNHMWRFLQSLGWSVQKPEKRARERDEKAISHWKRHAWPHIKKGRKA